MTYSEIVRIRLSGSVHPLDQTLSEIARMALTYPDTFAATTRRDRLGGSATRHARLWLADYSGGLCVLCGKQGDALGKPRAPMTLESGHLLPLESLDAICGCPEGERWRTGYIAGNIAPMHCRCNALAGSTVLDSKRLARPDLVPLSWPGFHKRGVTAQPR